jgi:hypothetical protein
MSRMGKAYPALKGEIWYNDSIDLNGVAARKESLNHAAT